MTDRIETIVIVTDKGSQTFLKVGDSAQKMGKQVDEAAKKSSRSLDDMKKSATAIGAGIGVLAGGLALAGRASLQQEQSIRGLEIAYKDASDQIIDFTESIQENTVFSNEQARQSAQVASTLARNYGFTADEIEKVIEVSADLATVTGFDLADASQRVAAALRGEAESAEALGLTMNQAAIDREGVTLTMSNEEAAHFRLNALLEQAAFAEGAAGERAATRAGQVQQLTNEVQDQIVAFGEWTGVTGQTLGQLGDLALVLPLVGAGVGRLGAAATAIVPAITGVGAALGPIGLAATALAAVGALVFLTDTMGDDIPPAADSAATAIDELNTTIERQISLGSKVAPLSKDVGDSLIYIGNAANGYNTELAALQKTHQDAFDDLARMNEASMSGTEAYAAQEEAVFAASMAIDNYIATQGKNSVSNEKLAAATDAANEILTATGPAASLAQDTLELLFKAEQAGTLSTKEGETQWQAYIRQIIELGDQLPIMNLNMIESGVAIDGTTKSVQDATVATVNYVDILREEAAAQIALQGAVDASAEAFRGATAAVAETAIQGAIVSRAFSPDNIIATNQALREQEGAYYRVRDGVISASDAQAIFKQTQDGILSSQEPFNHQLSEYNTQLNNLTNAEDLLNQRRAEGIPLTAQQEDFLSRVDAAQARLQGGTEDATLALGDQALQYAENMRLGDEMNQGLGTLDSSIQDLILALQGIPGYVKTNIEVDAEDAKLQADIIKRQLDALNGRTSYASVVITGYYTGPNTGLTPGQEHGGVIPHAQHGIYNRDGRTVLVGESGPELVDLPGGSRVTPSPASKLRLGKGGGDGMVITGNTFYVTANNASEFTESMRAWSLAQSRG